MTNDLGLDELFASRSRSRQTRARTRGTVSGETAPGETVSRETRLKRSGTRETVSGETNTADTVTAGTVSGETVTPETSGRPTRRKVGRPPAPVGERWEDRTRRAAYYLDVAVLEELEHYCARSGATKSEVVREALRSWLAQRL